MTHTNARIHTAIYHYAHVMHKHAFIFIHTTPHKHAHITICMQDEYFPLYIASRMGHDRIVKMLLQAGTTVDLQTKVENYSLIFCHLCCAMLIIHCTLSTTQPSKKYQCQKTSNTKPLLICIGELNH